MAQLLEKHNIDVPYFARKNEPEKLVEPPEQCHNEQPQGKDCYALIIRVKSFSNSLI